MLRTHFLQLNTERSRSNCPQKGYVSVERISEPLKIALHAFNIGTQAWLQEKCILEQSKLKEYCCCSVFASSAARSRSHCFCY